MATKHKLATDWDPEHKVWNGSCSCKNWFFISSNKSRIQEEFKEHLKE